jgi:acyl-CoA synthetase (AMP-forming)/AMP-acid ligase II
VLLRLGNTVDFPVAFLGAVAADLVPVPTAAGLTEPEITRLARFVAPVRHPRCARHRPARSRPGFRS